MDMDAEEENEQSSEAQSVTSQIFRAGPSSNVRWEKYMDEQWLRDASNDLLFQEKMRMMAREHDLNVAILRSRVAREMDALTEKLCAAMQRLDAMEPESLITPTQKLAYKMRHEVVVIMKAQFGEMKEVLARARYDCTVDGNCVQQPNCG